MLFFLKAHNSLIFHSSASPAAQPLIKLYENNYSKMSSKINIIVPKILTFRIMFYAYFNSFFSLLYMIATGKQSCFQLLVFLSFRKRILLKYFFLHIHSECGESICTRLAFFHTVIIDDKGGTDQLNKYLNNAECGTMGKRQKRSNKSKVFVQNMRALLLPFLLVEGSYLEWVFRPLDEYPLVLVSKHMQSMVEQNV